MDTVTADAEQLPAAAKSWREDLTNRYSAWTQFREGLQQYIQTATEVHTRVETEIVAQPIGVHLKELDASKNKLQVIVFRMYIDSAFILYVTVEDKTNYIPKGRRPHCKKDNNYHEGSEYTEYLFTHTANLLYIIASLVSFHAISKKCIQTAPCSKTLVSSRE